MFLDSNEPKQAHASQRLHDEQIAWLGSTWPDGRPHMVPVWFLWHEEKLLVFSQPTSQKVRNLKQNPAVWLSLDNTSGGQDVVIIEGTAELPAARTVGPMLPAYLEKYAKGIKGLGMTPEIMAATFSQAIVITPIKLRQM